MISAATAATAVLMVTLVKDYGLQYLLAATVLAGLLQISAGIIKIGYLMRFVSRSVITGFVNALAILIFLAQLPELDPFNVPTLTFVFDKFLSFAEVDAMAAIVNRPIFDFRPNATNGFSKIRPKYKDVP